MKGVKVNKMELKENFKMLERIYNMRQEEIFTIDEILKRKLKPSKAIQHKSFNMNLIILMVFYTMIILIKNIH